MSEAFSTPRNRIKTLVFLMICGLSAVVSGVTGIDDNPPGVLLAFLAGIAFVLAFTHPWRTARKFVFLLLASALGFVVFVVLNIIFDSITQNPSAPVALQDFIQSPVNEALSLVFSMICAAAFLVGVVGSVVMFIRSCRQRT